MQSIQDNGGDIEEHKELAQAIVNLRPRITKQLTKVESLENVRIKRKPSPANPKHTPVKAQIPKIKV